MLIDDTVATIQLHAPLAYGRTYRVEIDAEVFGVPTVKQWTFSTKPAPPPRDARRIVVAADGSGDFSSVQGAVDFVPERPAQRVTIFVRNGVYEEIVNLRDKANLSVIGEDRERTVIRYANNGVFNARPDGPDPAEMLRRFPNRRAVFAATRVHGLHVANLTLQSMGDKPAQAEALLILGEQAIVSHVTIDGSGDALQASGTVYVGDSQVKGYGDNVLGAGAVFFKDCDMVSTFGPHVWVRNGEGQRGNVFVDCRFRTTGGAQTVFARAPTNNGIDYPHAEVVLLNSRVDGVRPEGWGAVGPDIGNIRYREFDTRDLVTGAPVDVSRRAPHSQQLTMEKDAATIAAYRDPAFVLKLDADDGAVLRRGAETRQGGQRDRHRGRGRRPACADVSMAEERPADRGRDRRAIEHRRPGPHGALRAGGQQRGGIGDERGHLHRLKLAGREAVISPARSRPAGPRRSTASE